MVLSTTAKDVTERSLLLLIFLLHITTLWGKGLGLQDSEPVGCQRSPRPVV